MYAVLLISAVGVPQIVPLLVSKFIPAGRVPLNENDVVTSPALTLIGRLYVCPFVNV